MTVIADGLLARRYNEIEAKKEQIDSSNVLPLLAAIADHWLKGDADAMLPKLQAASSKQEQLEIVHALAITSSVSPCQWRTSRRMSPEPLLNFNSGRDNPRVTPQRRRATCPPVDDDDALRAPVTKRLFGQCFHFESAGFGREIWLFKLDSNQQPSG